MELVRVLVHARQVRQAVLVVEQGRPVVARLTHKLAHPIREAEHVVHCENANVDLQSAEQREQQKLVRLAVHEPVEHRSQQLLCGNRCRLAVRAPEQAEDAEQLVDHDERQNEAGIDGHRELIERRGRNERGGGRPHGRVHGVVPDEHRLPQCDQGRRGGHEGQRRKQELARQQRQDDGGSFPTHDQRAQSGDDPKDHHRRHHAPFVVAQPQRGAGLKAFRLRGRHHRIVVVHFGGGDVDSECVPLFQRFQLRAQLRRLAKEARKPEHRAHSADVTLR
mmetsp:Transcript_7765/g.24219  ORF Transcript_7765/g.24219 Transcript_7765/m.24219 type:complete len:278 (-) Transcript_7765:84-917(-)